jgi:hypothetical protein
MEHPVRVAFCKILFWKNGGQFSPTGLPVVNAREQVRGKCTRAYDCGQCSYLQEWIAFLQQQGWSFGWECDTCLKKTEVEDRKNGVERHVQGYYQAGRKYETQPEDQWNWDPDRPGLEGCTRCGWESSFLQLVIRRG